MVRQDGYLIRGCEEVGKEDNLVCVDIVQRINIQRLRWFRHVVRMEEYGSARRLFDKGI